MASSFGAAAITVLRDDRSGSLPGWSRPSHIAERQIPLGDQVTQLLGHGAERVTYRLWLTAAEYTALRALSQTSATLTLADVSQGTCTLLALTDEEIRPNGDYLVSALFERA